MKCKNLIWVLFVVVISMDDTKAADKDFNNDGQIVGGEIYNQVNVYNTSVVDMFGGSVGNLTAWDDSSVSVFSGGISALVARENRAPRLARARRLRRSGTSPDLRTRPVRSRRPKTLRRRDSRRHRASPLQRAGSPSCPRRSTQARHTPYVPQRRPITPAAVVAASARVTRPRCRRPPVG